MRTNNAWHRKSYRRVVEYNMAKAADPKPRFYHRGYDDGLAGKPETLTTRMDAAAVKSYRYGYGHGAADRANAIE